MKLKEIRISNYRCFGVNETILNLDDISVLIGCNSSGKTAIMSAISKILSNNSFERIIKRSDFHLPKGMSPDSVVNSSLYIELIFIFPELSDPESNLNAIPIFFRNFVIKEPNGMPQMVIRLDSTWRRSNSPDGAVETELYYKCGGVDSGKKTRATRMELDSIRLIYIPALRDIEKEVRYVAGTLMQRLFNLVNWDETKKQEIKEKSDSLNDAILNYKQIEIIQRSLKDNWAEFNVDRRFTDSRFTFSNSEIIEILKKISVGFSPSVTDRNLEISELGDGSKSLFYFTLISTILDAESRIIEAGLNSEIEVPLLTILLAEEPENHIAPHLLGQLVLALSQISNKLNGQSIISSHSPDIISRIDPLNIRILRSVNSTLSSEIKQIHLDEDSESVESFKYIKDAIKKHPKLYYSKLIILVEGESEEIVLPRYLSSNGINVDKEFISIVPLYSRFVSQFWKLLNEIDIPFITFVDLDKERSCGGWKKIAYLLCELKKIGRFPQDIDLGNGKYLFRDRLLGEISSQNETLIEEYKCWINFLEDEDVYLSSPLDLDFMLLSHYKTQYLLTLDEGEGPRINGLGKIAKIEHKVPITEQYKTRVQEAVQTSLKSEGGNGDSYSIEERKLMIWYNYFFLGRGKPASHYLAFKLITDVVLNSNIPVPIKNLLSKIEEKLG